MMNSVEETKCLALPTGEISSGKGDETIFVLLQIYAVTCNTFLRSTKSTQLRQVRGQTLGILE